MIKFTILCLIGYLLGSISSAICIAKYAHLEDPRTTGSKNPGATNMLRCAGKKWAGMVLLADAFKGLLPVLLARLLGVQNVMLGLVGISAIVGHILPVFFGFKGGKGVATTLGVLLGLSFYIGLLAIGTWLLVAMITRYSSLAAICSVVLTPAYAVFVQPPISSVVFSLISILVLIRHKDNLFRLIDGTEPKTMGKIQES